MSNKLICDLTSGISILIHEWLTISDFNRYIRLNKYIHKLETSLRSHKMYRFIKMYPQISDLINSNYKVYEKLTTEYYNFNNGYIETMDRLEKCQEGYIYQLRKYDIYIPENESSYNGLLKTAVFHKINLSDTFSGAEFQLKQIGASTIENNKSYIFNCLFSCMLQIDELIKEHIRLYTLYRTIRRNLKVDFSELDLYKSIFEQAEYNIKKLFGGIKRFNEYPITTFNVNKLYVKYSEEKEDSNTYTIDEDSTDSVNTDNKKNYKIPWQLSFNNRKDIQNFKGSIAKIIDDCSNNIYVVIKLKVHIKSSFHLITVLKKFIKGVCPNVENIEDIFDFDTNTLFGCYIFPIGYKLEDGDMETLQSLIENHHYESSKDKVILNFYLDE